MSNLNKHHDAVIALNRAVDYAVAVVHARPGTTVSTQQIVDSAQSFYDFLQKNGS